MATSVLPFDELNKFADQIRNRYGKEKLKAEDAEDIIDELFDLFLLSYAMGNEVTGENLGKSWRPSVDDVEKTVNAKVAGKTWKERVEDYFANGGSVDDIVRIAETEMHRIANTAALDTAKKIGATKKTWATMRDDKVRTDHDYLEGSTVGIDEDFYTWQGYHAPAPGMFGVAEEDVNCRCELIFS